MEFTDYNLELFLKLNKEYETKPIIPQPRAYDPSSQKKRGEDVANKLFRTYDLAGKRILEVGCGLGEVASHLQHLTGAEILAVDVDKKMEWSDNSNPHIKFRQCDLTNTDLNELGKFDFIYSLAVLEHVKHPYSMLNAIHKLLADDGLAYIYFNLFRGPQASHCYRVVYFPWPHLLFDDSVFRDFYRTLDRAPQNAAWVNRHSIADYFNFLQLIDFKVKKHWYWEAKFDEEFYNRFEDMLGRYPKFDLNKDFLHLELTK